MSDQSCKSFLTNDGLTPGRLVLADGDVMDGFSFGAVGKVSGEVVFYTGMVGYPESLTDPSYCGQILVLTSPMIGNYGVPPDEKDKHGLPKYFESDRIHAAGLIVTDYSDNYSHWNAIKSLSQWLKESNVPALLGIDTRRLTKRLRDHGTLPGQILFGSDVPGPFEDPNTLHLVQRVSPKGVRVLNPDGQPRVLVLDCGMKTALARSLISLGMCLIVVPYDYPLASNPLDLQYDGIFASNGPGDPAKCKETIASLAFAISQVPPKPILGICLGNQLLALAAGGRTYKMRYGHRSANQAVVDLRSRRAFMTSQNHGFAVDDASLPSAWKTLYVNANDLTNEGIIHADRPFLAAQFHPEGCAGPDDGQGLFKSFLDLFDPNYTRPMHLAPIGAFKMAQRKKILLIGSGGLSIGQAGEFDYSGSQALKALKEEGVEVVLINPNIATVQTSKGPMGADRVYFLPITPQVVTEVLVKERPDGVIVSMGGQTALNVGLALWRDGTFAKYGVEVLGTTMTAIETTEDRALFNTFLSSIGESAARSASAGSIEEACLAAEALGYPVLVRAAYALGGLGSGFAANKDQLVDLARVALSGTDRIYLDEDLRGWKEVEYEVVRDASGQVLTVCHMENMDPLGVHTGDSIVVAPCQTLSNSEVYMLRRTALKVITALGVVGECNIQFALDPHSEVYRIVEVNARLSRSSALASKATGYPLAYVACKLLLGHDLLSLRNHLNGSTTALLEPALDYIVVKLPRWDLGKFHRVANGLGSAMCSVGEVMAIGRTFEEAIQKGVRMVSGGAMDGLDGLTGDEDLKELIAFPTDRRLYALQRALEDGWELDELRRLSGIDHWFLARLANIAKLKRAAKGELNTLKREGMLKLKQAGFSDRQLAACTNTSEEVVRAHRLSLDVRPVVKQIDTLAAEHPCGSASYLYLTYHGQESDARAGHGGVLVLGCGAYCIGSSVEFDWCAVSAVRQLRAMGVRTLVMNCNPETVSTDYDESDVLYFEEVSRERVLDIYALEDVTGVIVSVGGQVPNNLASGLAKEGVKILGTAPQDIDRAEDRGAFGAMLDSLGIDQPAWSALTTTEEALRFAEQVGYPVLVRPSFVLSGAAMSVAICSDQLLHCLQAAQEVSADKPVVISKYILEAKEIEFDAVAQAGRVLNYAISEHIENAGVHSGDATLVLPAQKLYVQTVRQVKRIAAKIAEQLSIHGPFNLQLLAKGNKVQVIECNLRASRTFPFVSKTLGANFITLATKVMVQGMAGMPAAVAVKPYNISLYDYDYVSVKAPIFSFPRLRGADPTCGVEMASTGEVACFGADLPEAFLQALIAAHFVVPAPGANILLSIAEDRHRLELLPAARILQDMGYNLLATPGTAAYYTSQGLAVTMLSKDDDSAAKWIRERRVGLLVNIPEGSRRDEVTYGYRMRRAAVDYGVSLLTNTKCAALFVDALQQRQRRGPQPILSAEDFLAKAPIMGHVGV